MGTRGKPVLVITEQNIDKAADIIRSTIGRLNPETVNIAGHRESSHPGIEQFVKQALVRGLGNLPEKPKVISSPPAQPKKTNQMAAKKTNPSSAQNKQGSIPDWVYKNSTTAPLVPLIEEAQAAGYKVDFGPTGRSHASGKKVAASVNHDKKLIRVDVRQIQEDFSTKAWTKPQVEGVKGISRNFKNAGELAKFYLMHELEHLNPERLPVLADNENATNERALKRMLPNPTSKKKPKKEPKKEPELKPNPNQYGKPIGPMKQGTPPAINQGLPTTAELGALWEKLSALPSNRFSVSSINKAVDELVKAKKVRPAIAPVVKAYATYAEDLMRRRDEPIDPVRAAKGLDERYFLGGVSEAETPEERRLLRAARAGEKPEVKRTPLERPMRSIGIPKDAEEFLRRSLQTPAGRKLTEATVRFQQRKEGKPSAKNPLSRIRPRAPRPTSSEKPYVSKGSTLAKKMLGAKLVGKNVGSRATTKSGKPVYYTFKGSNVPKFYKSQETFEEVFGPRGSDVLVGLVPPSKTAYAEFNEAAKTGSPERRKLAALLLETQKIRNFKAGERFRESMKTTTGPIPKPPNERGEYLPVMQGGKPVLRTETPSEKARRQARNESKYVLGLTPSEEAKRLQRGKRKKGSSVERVRKVKAKELDRYSPEDLSEEAIKQRVEDRIRKGLQGPFQREAFQKLQALKAKELARYEDLRRLSRLRTRPNPPKTSREIADEVAALRSERNLSPALRRIDRLNRIIAAHGGMPRDLMVATPERIVRPVGGITPYDPMDFPVLPSKPSRFYEMQMARKKGLPPSDRPRWRPTQGPIPPRGYYSKGRKAR